MTSPTKEHKSKASQFFKCNLEDLLHLLRVWKAL